MEEEKQRARRARRLTLALAAIAAVAVCAGILAYRNQIRAQESETLVRDQAALTEYRNATDEQQQNHWQAAPAYLAKGARLDPANLTIRTAIPQLLYGSAWDPLRITPLRDPAPVRVA